MDDAVTAVREDLALDSLGKDMVTKSKALWFILIQTQAEKGLNIMQSTEKRNGFRAWKLICAEFQPQVRGRHNAMLTALLHPD